MGAAERQRRLRERRKEQGLVSYREWVTPAEAQALAELLTKLRDKK